MKLEYKFVNEGEPENETLGSFKLHKVVYPYNKKKHNAKKKCTPAINTKDKEVQLKPEDIVRAIYIDKLTQGKAAAKLGVYKSKVRSAFYEFQVFVPELQILAQWPNFSNYSKGDTAFEKLGISKETLVGIRKKYSVPKINWIAQPYSFHQPPKKTDAAYSEKTLDPDTLAILSEAFKANIK